MARYMSSEVVEQVLAGGESELGGKTQTVSILFSDVRNFTGVSEALGARELLQCSIGIGADAEHRDARLLQCSITESSPAKPVCKPILLRCSNTPGIGVGSG